MKYIEIDKLNKILGWYDSKYSLEVPKNAILIADELWIEANNKNALYYNVKENKFEFNDIEIENNIFIDKYNEAVLYLKNTDWIVPYILMYNLGYSILTEDSNKLIINEKRKFYINFLKDNENIIKELNL